MAASFDHQDRYSWYFGQLSRQEANDILLAERESGVFLIRDSTTSVGDYVLCVKEDSKVSHYIINRVIHNDEIRYRIGDQFFNDLPALLAFYKLHYLDTAPLIRPATKRLERVLAKYDFERKDPDDLSFKKGEILKVISKDEDQWWTAENSLGEKGLIPVPYVQKIDENDEHIETQRPGSGGPTSQNSMTNSEAPLKRYQPQRQLPAKAIVTQVRVPNAYDKTALKLEINDIITVTKTNINGQWEGELNGKIGHFPFTHVRFLEDDS